MELHDNLTERGFLPALKDRVSTAHPRMNRPLATLALTPLILLGAVPTASAAPPPCADAICIDYTDNDLFVTKSGVLFAADNPSLGAVRPQRVDVVYLGAVLSVSTAREDVARWSVRWTNADYDIFSTDETVALTPGLFVQGGVITARATLELIDGTKETQMYAFQMDALPAASSTVSFTSAPQAGQRTSPHVEPHPLLAANTFSVSVTIDGKEVQGNPDGTYTVPLNAAGKTIEATAQSTQLIDGYTFSNSSASEIVLGAGIERPKIELNGSTLALSSMEWKDSATGYTVSWLSDAEVIESDSETLDTADVLAGSAVTAHIKIIFTDGTEEFLITEPFTLPELGMGSDEDAPQPSVAPVEGEEPAAVASADSAWTPPSRAITKAPSEPSANLPLPTAEADAPTLADTGASALVPAALALLATLTGSALISLARRKRRVKS